MSTETTLPTPSRTRTAMKRREALFDGFNTPQNIAVHAFALGSVFGIGIMAASAAMIMEYHYFEPRLFLNRFAILIHPAMGIYLASLAWFHMSEYLTTALYNPRKLKIDSFLINNGISYHVAHLTALMEFTLSAILFPSWKLQFRNWSYIGLMMVIIGQIIRTLAQVHAGRSFSHIIARGLPAQDHVLVTNGIYAYSRHPSYLGFFIWAIGTQVMLRNPFSICSFTIVLWRFFNNRIQDEEIELVRFFGDDYKAYKRRTGTKIPFIK